MECLYYTGFDSITEKIKIDGNELKHIKALRIKKTDKVLISNGKNLIVEAELKQIDKNLAHFNVVKQHWNMGELDYKLGLALGILSDRNRFEFALEKAVELGVSDFYPLNSKFCEKHTIQTERLKNKSIAALKQSKRSKLINIHNIIELSDLIKLNKDYKQIVLADEKGLAVAEKLKKVDTLIIIGPEGGFDKCEIDLMMNSLDVKIINLANRRLRAETAAIAAISLVTNLIS